MKFFTTFFSTIYSRAYSKFSTNLFFLRHMLGEKIEHTLLPHIFIPSKNLKIKFFSSVKTTLFFYIPYFGAAVVIILSLYFVLISFSRPVVRITGFHPVDSGSIPD